MTGLLYFHFCFVLFSYPRGLLLIYYCFQYLVFLWDFFVFLCVYFCIYMCFLCFFLGSCFYICLFCTNHFACFYPILVCFPSLFLDAFLFSNEKAEKDTYFVECRVERICELEGEPHSQNRLHKKYLVSIRNRKSHSNPVCS